MVNINAVTYLLFKAHKEHVWVNILIDLMVLLATFLYCFFLSTLKETIAFIIIFLAHFN